jgi:hypothetical protein
MKLLFIVEQAVALAGKGLVLLPGVPQDASLAGATSVELRLPNGTSVAARVAGMAHFGRKPGAPTPLLVARSPPELEIPAGTEVWA